MDKTAEGNSSLPSATSLVVSKLIINIGSGRTGLTKFVSPFQNSRQNLSLPNFQFVKRGRIDTQQNIC